MKYFLLYNIYLLVYIQFQFLNHLCSVSSLASFMSNQETSFVTLGQRVLASPLKYVKTSSSFSKLYFVCHHDVAL